MPWLNWSLKLHIRLRTISLLIPTHNTQVYVQWIYSLVWLYSIKCVFTWSIFVDSNTKRFLSVLVVFGKYFVLQKLKISKTSVALFWRLSCGSVKSHATVAISRVSFGDLFASGRSSHEGYIEIFVAQLVTPSRVRLPVMKNTWQFFQIFWLDVFWQVKLVIFWRLNSVAKIVWFAKRSSFSILFSKRVLNCFSCILWLFIFWSHFRHFNTTVVNSKIFHYFVTIFSMFKERYGFLSSTLYSSLLLSFPRGFCALYDICISLDCVWISNCLVSSLCVFQWSYSDLLYIVTTFGHYCLSLSFSGHSHLVLRVFFIIHILNLTHY